MTILLVDDDDDLRELGVGLLSEHGYAVRAARNGHEGLVALLDDPGIRVLFTDIVMPGGMDGWELARRAKEIRPDIKVLYTSGFMKSMPPDGGGPSLGPLLPKPWRWSQLRAELQKLLGE